jgi:hypothetical protein
MFWGKKKKGAPSDLSVVWSKNMDLRVAAPSEPGWQRMEAGRQEDGMVAAIKCVHGTPPDAVALDALVYELDRAPSLEELRARDWEAYFRQKLFTEVDAIEVRDIEQLARAGFPSQGVEVRVDGRMRQPAQPLRLRERHVPVGNKLLVVSAAGRAARLDAIAKLVDSWLTHAALGGE